MKKILYTPISLKDIEDLRVGDVVYLTGTLVTGRDDVHRRVVHEGKKCPVDFSSAGLMHAGPIIKESKQGNEMVAIGPTSSIRMEEDAAEFIRITGLRIMIGKGGMGVKTAKACKQYGAIHCVFPGGCAVYAANKVNRIENVFWRELGMPEALWVMKVEEFGPLIVSIDTQGNNLFLDNLERYKSKLIECEQPILESVESIMSV